MRLRGIRFKLTIWYALAFSIAGSLVFLSFYLLARQALYYQTDSTLSTHGLKVMEVALRQGTGMHDDLAKQAFLDEFSKIPGMLIVIADDKGEIVGSSAIYGDSNETIASLMREVGRSDKQSFFSQRIGTSLLRFWTNPIAKDGRVIGVILVAHPIDVIENSLSDLVSAMSVVYVSLVMLTTFGGYWLAKGATSPIRDITEKITKIGTENLSEKVDVPKTGDEIEDLAQTFNGLLDRLDSAFKRERQFIGDVAHELKTPLATLMGEIELALTKKRKSDEYRRVLTEALVDARRLGDTLTNILDLAWSQTDAKLERVDLSAVVNDLNEVAKKLALAKRITVKNNIKAGIFVLGKKDKLSRAVLNLIDNAIKYTNEKGRVEINLNKEKGQAVIKVVDNGSGIGKTDLPHIFERFFRGNGPETAGSGLGLPIAQAIVEAHRGKLKVMGNSGKGTTAIIYLPPTKL
ncbi:MAG: ATP-binding protein [Patescibacteria group bacterium]